MNANQVLQRSSGVARGTLRIAERLGRRVVSDSVGIVSRASGLRREAKPEMDDVTLARKVETEIFRGSRVAKSKVNVNVVDGVVWLRGEVKTPNQVRTLEQKAHAVPEVRGVENLLHLPKTPAPTRADTPRRQQRTRSSTRRPTPRRSPAGRVTDDRTDAIARDAEPSPTEHASKDEGRTPAPLGSTGNGESSSDVGGAAAERSEMAPAAERSETAPAAERSETSPAAERSETSGLAGERHDGPGLAGEPTASAGERHDGPGLAGEPTASAGERHDGPGLAGERTEEPGFAGERTEEPGFSPDAPQQSPSHNEHEVGHTS